MDDQNPDTPGPVVRWETVTRTYDAADRLVSEQVVTTVNTVRPPEPPEPPMGLYL